MASIQEGYSGDWVVEVGRPAHYNSGTEDRGLIETILLEASEA